MPYRSKKYLEFIRARPCGICMAPGPNDPHHVRQIRWGAGTGIKPHDFVCVSRCRDHHGPEWDKGLGKEGLYGEIIDNLIEWITRNGEDVKRGTVCKKRC